MCPTIADCLFTKDSTVRICWDYLRTFNHDIADAESARRFWSIFEFAFSPRGVTNMYRFIPYNGDQNSLTHLQTSCHGGDTIIHH